MRSARITPNKDGTATVEVGGLSRKARFAADGELEEIVRKYPEKARASAEGAGKPVENLKPQAYYDADKEEMIFSPEATPDFVTHETFHVFERAGIITPEEIGALGGHEAAAYKYQEKVKDGSIAKDQGPLRRTWEFLKAFLGDQKAKESGVLRRIVERVTEQAKPQSAPFEERLASIDSKIEGMAQNIARQYPGVEADDLAQDARTHLLENDAKWDPYRPYENWALTAARNAMNSSLTAKGKKPLPGFGKASPAEELTGTESTPAEIASAKEQATDTEVRKQQRTDELKQLNTAELRKLAGSLGVKQGLHNDAIIEEIVAKEMAGTTKEPWQMTRDEFYRKSDKNASGTSVIYSGVVHPSMESVYASDLPNYASHMAETAQGQTAPNPGSRNEGVVRLYWADDTSHKFLTENEYSIRPDSTPFAELTPGEVRGGAHKALVMRAIASGKPVPPEVLADYPDLQAKEMAGEGETKTPTTPISGQRPKATDTSVRDHPQQAEVRGDKIIVTSKVGRQSVATIDIPLSDWERESTTRGKTANPNWNKLALIRRLTQDLDDQPGGPDQADRIRDSMVRAIDKAMAKREATEPQAESPPAAATPTIQLPGLTFELPEPTFKSPMDVRPGDNVFIYGHKGNKLAKGKVVQILKNAIRVETPDGTKTLFHKDIRDVAVWSSNEQPEVDKSDQLSTHFAKRFDSGALYRSIVDARNEASSVIGKPINPGTEEARKLEESIEQGVVLSARKIVAEGKSPQETYQRLVDLYNRQPMLGTRSSDQAKLQAFSTPAPLAYIASQEAGIGPETTVHEPTAGHAMLLIGAAPENVYANEIDPDRAKFLESQGFATSKLDAAGRQGVQDKPVAAPRSYEVVIANPPFGTRATSHGTSEEFQHQGVKTTAIDQAIAMRALEAMGNNGRAVLILGSKGGEVDPKSSRDAMRGKSKAYSRDSVKPFFDFLYDNYNVVDHYTVSGDLYSKQGASFPVDVIVIDGRERSNRARPWDIVNGGVPNIYRTWEELGNEKLANRRGTAGVEPGRVEVRGPTAAGDQGTDVGRVPSPAGTQGGVAGGELQGGGGKPAGDVRGGMGEGGVSGTRPGVGEPGARPSQLPAGGQGGTVEGPVPVQGGAPTGGGGGRTGARPGGVAGGTDTGKPRQIRIDELSPEDRRALLRHVMLGGTADTFVPKGSQQEAKQEPPPAEQPSTELPTETTAPIEPAKKSLGSRREWLEKQGTLKPKGAESKPTQQQQQKQQQQQQQQSQKPTESKPQKKKLGEQGSGAQASQEMTDAARRLAENMAKLKEVLKKKMKGGSALQMMDPEIIEAILPVIEDALLLGLKTAKAGVYNFAEFVNELRRGIGDDDLIRLSGPSIEQTWKQLAQIEDRLGPAGFVTDILDPKSADAENEHQIGYTPKSAAPKKLNSLVPKFQRTAVERALQAIEMQHGDIDAYVADRLGISVADLHAGNAAEQTDTLALAIYQHENGQRGFIMAHQTGLGKGRVMGGMMRYANKLGNIPVFFTEKSVLFADIMRDLTDIGYNTTEQPFNFVVTGNFRGDQEIELDEENDPNGRSINWSGATSRRECEELAENISSGAGAFVTRDDEKVPIHAIFTTYTQMNEPHGLWRRSFLHSINAHCQYLLDESHNAGGSESKPKPQKVPTALFLRDKLQHSAGAMFSSATWGKRPEVMDLYFRTNLGQAFTTPARMGDVMKQGGIPLQQVVSEMLVDSGAMIRLEQNYNGIDFTPEVREIDLSSADRASAVFRGLQAFSDELKNGNNPLQGITDIFTSQGGDVQTYKSPQSQANIPDFASGMHNISSQLQFSLKAEEAAQRAIESAKTENNAVIIAVDNTMEKMLDEFAAENNHKDGDLIDYRFKDVFMRHLEKARTVKIKAGPHTQSTPYRLSDDDLGPEALRLWNETRDLVDQYEDDLPASPIDWIRYRLDQAGLRVREITGREKMAQYNPDGTMTLISRPSDEKGPAGKRRTVKLFQTGGVDVVLLNRSGATGTSMHASVHNPPEGRKRRHMIIAQAALNVDEFMQILGRINRVGQVQDVVNEDGTVTKRLPLYSLLMTNAPADLRPASVLMRKMANLNANTTSNKAGNVSFDVPDIFNQVGDQAILQYMRENPDINRQIGYPLPVDKQGVPGLKDGDHGSNTKARHRSCHAPAGG